MTIYYRRYCAAKYHRIPMRVRRLLLFTCSLVLASPVMAQGGLSRTCTYVGPSSSMMHLSFPAVSITGHGEVRMVPADNTRSNRPCWQVIRGESTVLIDEGLGVHLSVADNICGSTPQFFIYDAEKIYSIYPAYYTSGQLTQGPMVRRSGAVVAVTTARCGKPPSEFRFAARKILRRAPATQHGRLREVNAGDEFSVFFSARVVIGDKSYRLISDDPAQEKAWFRARRQGVEQARIEDEQRRYNQAVGAIIGMLLLGSKPPEDSQK